LGAGFLQFSSLQTGFRRSGSVGFVSGRWKGWRRNEKKLLFSGCTVLAAAECDEACARDPTATEELCELEPALRAEVCALEEPVAADEWLLAEWFDPPPAEPPEELE
jgi:hypothetical protein